MARGTTMNIQILRLENRVAASGVELDGNDPKCPKLEPGQVVSISGDDTVVVSGRRVEFASLVEERDGDTVVRRDPVTGERAEEIGTQWYVNGEEKLLSDVLAPLMKGDNPKLVQTKDEPTRPLRFSSARVAKLSRPSANPIQNSEIEERERILRELEEGNFDV